MKDFQHEHDLFLFGAISDPIGQVQSWEKALLTAKNQWIKQLIIFPQQMKNAQGHIH